jgi:hypothetical protein
MELSAHSPQRARRSFTFTTVNLLFATAFIITIVSHIFASRELHELKGLEREVQKLRGELGYFEPNDSAKCYVTCAPQIEKDAFTFRLYLPPGHQYVWKSSYRSHNARPVRLDGMLNYQIRIDRSNSELLRLDESGFGHWTSIPLDGLKTSEPRSKQFFTFHPEHYKNVREFKVGEPIKLISIGFINENRPIQHDQIEIWLEEPNNPLKREKEDEPVDVEQG